MASSVWECQRLRTAWDFQFFSFFPVWAGGSFALIIIIHLFLENAITVLGDSQLNAFLYYWTIYHCRANRKVIKNFPFFEEFILLSGSSTPCCCKPDFCMTWMILIFSEVIPDWIWRITEGPADKGEQLWFGVCLSQKIQQRETCKKLKKKITERETEKVREKQKLVHKFNAPATLFSSSAFAASVAQSRKTS